MVGLAKARQEATGVKLLWGTANLFSHPRYMNGASTNPDFAVVARAAVQVKAALRPRSNSAASTTCSGAGAKAMRRWPIPR